ncbi:hydroxymethylglutaryl-CoA synthase family protein [Streptomyces sp. NPDC059076]|uniref:hydroxymethylglutaryl-CoA synthase family protein n=1 Tax=unclassified Streptomyces TaxID=2593676 RepID=UPI0036A513ED
MTESPRVTVGVEALDVYAGSAWISAADLAYGRNLDPARVTNLMLEGRSVALPFEDPVTHAVNAAKGLVDDLDPEVRARIELVLVATESGVDYSKSISSYVHRYLGLGPECRLLEVKQACYAATGALQLAAGYLASGASPDARVLLIATDVGLADERAEYAELATGSGAVALLLSEHPRVLELDLGAFGLHSFETMDTARPGPEIELADADLSLVAYLECTVRSFADYCRRVADVSFDETFDYLAFHTPFAGMVRAAHRRAMREFTGWDPAAVAADFTQRVEPSLHYPAQVGNLFSGSLYLALSSLVDRLPEAADGARVGLFSYGSGCSSEFLSGTVGEDARRAVSARGIGARLAARRRLTFAEYRDLLPLGQACLVPRQHLKVEPHGEWRPNTPHTEVAPMLALQGIENYHRRYEWI